MYALTLKGKTYPKLLTALSSSLTPQSFNPRGIDTHFTVVLLDTIRYTCRDLRFIKPASRHVANSVAVKLAPEELTEGVTVVDAEAVLSISDKTTGVVNS
ncbi:hypothetical protein PIB30_053604 [Stylosanthes scabra]|uniref:Uncharacterized protein n=1 Tax=Stylosanthes scabra TaxID=79078 RepID=A0ABU6ZHC4_9FABA|nr:hypothetical protein [Stylosanthes scabra]